MKLSTTYPRSVSMPKRVIQEKRVSPRKAHFRRRYWFLIYFLAVVLAISFPFAVVASVGLYFQAAGRILPGVHVGNISLNGKTPAQAAIEIQQANLDSQMTVTDGVRSWTLSPQEAGFPIDALKTAQNAALYGRQGSLWGTVQSLSDCLRSSCQMAPVLAYDPAQARATLERLAPQVAIQPVEATLHLEGTQIVTTPGVQGYQLDVETTLAQWSADPYRYFESRSLGLVLRPVQPKVSDFTPLINEIQPFLQAPVALHGYDPISDEWLDWSISPDQFAAWLRIDPNRQDQPVSLDETQVAAYLSQIDASLQPSRTIAAGDNAGLLAQAIRNHQALTLLVKHLPTTYAVQSGDTLIRIAWKVGVPYWMILKANPGLDGNALRVGQELQIPSKDDLLPLPVIMSKRIVISISQQRMWTYQDGQQLNEYVISTGIDRSPTQPGVFQVRTHQLDAYAALWDLHMPHFLGIYESWPGFMNGIHGLPTLANGQRLWANVLGRPASYGCIILNLQAAEDLYNWAEDGVVVEIKE